MQLLPPLSTKVKVIFIITLILTIFLATFAALYNSQTVPLSKNKGQQPAPLPQRGSYVPNELIIKYKARSSPEELEEAIANRKPWEIFNRPEKRLQELIELDKQAGLVSKEKLFTSKDKNLRRYYVLKFRLKDSGNLAKIQELYLQHDFIEHAEPDLVFQAFATPNDTYYKEMWNLRKINMEQAWNLQKGSNTVTVAVLDTGVDYTHEDFQGRTIKNGTDFSSCNNVDVVSGICIQPKPRDNDSMDDNGHGTHVAGIIGAVTNNAKGIAGINWDVRLLVVKIMNANNGGIERDLVEGIMYSVDNKAMVINLSVGGEHSCPQALQDILNYALQKNVVIIVAAGNDPIDAANITPANCSGVISVGASTQSDQRAEFSNYGSRVNIAAPGVAILSLKSFNCINPTLCLPQQVVDGNYLYGGGTSMAAPHVAGVAALLLAKNPGLTPQDVKNCLVNYADSIPAYPPIGPRLNAYNSLLNCPSFSPTSTPRIFPTPIPTSKPNPTPIPTSPSGIGGRVTIAPTPAGPTATPGGPTTTPPAGGPTLTPKPTPTPTPILYECREVDTSPSTSGLQLKTLECTPK